MKILKSLLIFTVSGLLFVSCKENAKTAQTNEKSLTTAAVGKIETASFTISGMSCAVMCANKIEKELSAMDGVKKATVDFDKKLATVKYDSDKLSPEKLVEKVEAVADGKTYKVSNLKSSANKAIFSGDPEREKKRAERKAKKDAKKADKNKPACCSAGKKSCTMAEKATM
jgi:copper chaperone CopZ